MGGNSSTLLITEQHHRIKMLVQRMPETILITKPIINGATNITPITIITNLTRAFT